MFRFVTSQTSNQDNLIKVQGARDFSDYDDVSGLILQNYDKNINEVVDISSITVQNSKTSTIDNQLGDLVFKMNDSNLLQESIRLTHNGYLGINTDSPSEYLTVNGNAQITSNMFVNNSVNTPIINFTTSPTNTVSTSLNSTSNYIAKKVLVSTDGDTVTSAPDLHWDSSNSYLGIGTSTPQFELDVKGTINSSSNVIASSFEGDGSDLLNVGLNQSVITINVPTDFPTVQSALDHLLLKKISNQQTTQQHIINIESGYQLGSNIECKNADFSHIKIQSVDASVLLSSGFPTGSVLKIDNAKGPVIDCLIDLQGTGTGIIVTGPSSALTILPNKGLINAGQTGLHVTNGAIIEANTANFSGCGTALFVDHCSFVSAPSLNGQNAKTIGLYVDKGSRVNVPNANFSGCTGPDYTIFVKSGMLNCENALLNNISTISGLFATHASIVNCMNITIANADFLIQGQQLSIINAQESVLSSWNTLAVSIGNGSTVNLTLTNQNSGGITETATNVSTFNTISNNGIIYN